MKTKRNILVVIVSFLCIFSVITQKIESKEDYLDKINSLSYYTFDLGYDLINPSWNVFPYQSETDFNKEMLMSKQLLQTLEEETISGYSSKTQKVLNATKDYYKRHIVLENDYYIYSNYLSKYFGTPNQMNFYLSNYQLSNEDDIKRLINVLNSSEEQFDKYIKLELKRQQKNVGINLFEANTIQGNCDMIINNIKNHMMNQYTEQINRIKTLTNEQKNSYIYQVRKALYEVLIPSITKIKEFILNYEKDFVELTNEQSSEYLSDFIIKQIGIDDSIEKIKDVLDRNMKFDEIEITTYDSLYEDLIDVYYDKLQIKVKETDLLNDLEKNQLLAKLFFSHVSIANNDNHYLLSSFIEHYYYEKSSSTQDNYISIKDKIKLIQNYGYTMYPGLSYQRYYYKENALDSTIKKFDYPGFRNGWNMYASNILYRIYEKENYYYKYDSLLNNHENALLCLLDIYVNYEHATMKEAYELYSEKSYKDISEQEFKTMYNTLKAYPGAYLEKYLMSIYMKDLQVLTEKMTGEENITLTHDVILQSGPTSYSNLESNLKEKIRSEL